MVNPINDKTIARILVAAILVSIGLAALAFSGVLNGRRGPEARYESIGATYQRVEFRDLAGWRLDDVFEALPALLRSCERMTRDNSAATAPALADLAGAPEDWRALCAEAARVAALPYVDASARSSAVRAFFEFHFRPVRVLERTRRPSGAEDLVAEGRFTAYFEPFYRASATRTEAFSAALYARPADLVSVDLGQFRPELAGERIAGRVVGGALQPYPDHSAINAGALAGRARVLAWMRPTDLFFLQVQGSGRIAIGDEVLRVGYDGANGRPYTAIGRTLVERGAMTLETVSMQTIRAWLDKAPPDEARAVRETNQSFVFFRVLEHLPDPALGPLGAEGVQLTPGRSLAVDPRFTPLGAPVWISIPGDPEAKKDPVRRLLVAQDSGGAIKGPIRGDIFVGSGPEAGNVAGAFNELGALYVLVPARAAARLERVAAR